MTTLKFTAQPKFKPAARLIIGNKEQLTFDAASKHDLPAELLSIVKDGKADSASQWLPSGELVNVVHLDSTRKRNLGYIRSDLIAELVAKHTPKEKDSR
jgi:hypothetical protein